MIKNDVHIEVDNNGDRHVRIILLGQFKPFSIYVVLCTISGWLGSKMQYLNKYSSKWADLSCSTINVIDTRNFFRQFWIPGRSDEVAETVMKELIKDKSDDKPVILHVFSNGGCTGRLQVLGLFDTMES